MRESGRRGDGELPRKPKAGRTDWRSWDGNIYGLRKIGQGGTAFVFALDDWTAVKVPVGSPASLLAFERERDVYRRLMNRPCRHVLTCFETEFDSALVLERCRESVRNHLARRLRGEGIGTEKAARLAIRWSYQAATGIACLHDEGVIQADVGCHNMLLDERDNLKIADFSGSSIDGSESPAMVDYDIHGRLPQVDEPNRQSDLFALGSAMYEMATGRVPYHGLSPRQITHRFKEGIFPTMADLRAAYPEFAKAIEGCWRLKFDNAHQVAEHLRRHYHPICESRRPAEATPRVSYEVVLQAPPRTEKKPAISGPGQIHKSRHDRAAFRQQRSDGKAKRNQNARLRSPGGGDRGPSWMSFLIRMATLKIQ